MAFENVKQHFEGAEAGSDMSALQHRCVRQALAADVPASAAAAGQMMVSAADESVLGVLQNKPDAAERAASVGVSGRTKCEASAAIVAGASVKAAASGKAVTAATGNNAFGYAVTAAGADGEIFTVSLEAHVAL